MLFIVKFKPLKLGSSIHHFGQLGDSKSRIHSEWAWNLANRNLWSYWWPRHIYPVNLCRWADGYASKLTQVTRIYNAYSEHGLNWIQRCEWGRKTHLNPVGRQLVFSPSGWPCVCPLVVIFQAFFLFMFVVHFRSLSVANVVGVISLVVRVCFVVFIFGSVSVTAISCIEVDAAILWDAIACYCYTCYCFLSSETVVLAIEKA